MEAYKFETAQFGISETGIHLFGRRFNFETVDFKEMYGIIIERERQENNWPVILLLGGLLIVASLAYCYTLLNEYLSGQFVMVFYIEQFILPIIPLGLGIYVMYNALKLRLNIVVLLDDEALTLSIEEIKKAGELNQLIEFLQRCQFTRDKVSINESEMHPLVPAMP